MMKRYFTNLALALCGKNPQEQKIKRLTAKHKETVKQVFVLDELCAKFRARVESAEKKVAEYQNVIELYRKRLSEKDILIKRIKDGYKGRIDDYTTEISQHI